MITSGTECGHNILIIGRDVGKLSDENTKRLKRLLKLNHDNYSILYNNYRFHNHSPHFLGSAYLYDGSSDYLQAIYDDIVFRNNLESWTPSPGQITPSNYRSHLSDGAYQCAWVDFFELQMKNAQHDRDWKAVVFEFLLDTGPTGATNSAPMFHCLISALGHPLIHLGYAFELNSPELAAEALGLVATCYDEQYATILSAKPTSTSTSSAAPKPTHDLLEIFQRISNDTSLPTFPQPGDEHIEDVLEHPEYVQAVISHLNVWDLDSDSAVPSALSQAYHVASLLLISTSPQLGRHGYDFFLVHMLTTIHAVRVLLPHLPDPQHRATLLKEWLLVAILAYIAQNRPRLDLAYVKDFKLRDGQDWGHVRQQAISGKYSVDAHFVKACRAMHVAVETWKGRRNDNNESDSVSENGTLVDDDWFLKCAVLFVTEFDGWGGFNTAAEDAELVKENRKKDGIYVR